MITRPPFPEWKPYTTLVSRSSPPLFTKVSCIFRQDDIQSFHPRAKAETASDPFLTCSSYKKTGTFSCSRVAWHSSCEWRTITRESDHQKLIELLLYPSFHNKKTSRVTIDGISFFSQGISHTESFIKTHLSLRLHQLQMKRSTIIFAVHSIMFYVCRNQKKISTI